MVRLHDEVARLESAVDAVERVLEELAARAGRAAEVVPIRASEPEDDFDRAAIETRLDRAITRLEAVLRA